jgi:hypothetical protein
MDKDKGRVHVMMQNDLVKREVEMCRWWSEGGAGELEGVLRLMGEAGTGEGCSRSEHLHSTQTE